VARVLIAVLFLFSACSTGPSAFDVACDLDTIDAYEAFLDAHPQDPHTAEARARIAELRFVQAKSDDTIESWQFFLEDHPDSRYAADARAAIERLRTEAADARLQRAIDSSDYGRLLAMARVDGSDSDQSLREAARLELAQWTTDTLDDELRIATGPGGAASRAPTHVLEFRASARGALDASLSTLLDDNRMDREFEVGGLGSLRGLSGATGREERARMRDGTSILYLHPSAAGDVFDFRQGSLELRDRVHGECSRMIVTGQRARFDGSTDGGGPGQVLASIERMGRCDPSDRVFSRSRVHESTTARSVVHLGLVLVVSLPDTSGPATVYAVGQHWESTTGRTVRTGISSPAVPVRLHGTARLPADTWVTLRPGLAARRGAIVFEGGHAALNAGTEVARREPVGQPAKR